MIAQINERDTINHAIQLQLGGSYQVGNVELTRVTGRGEFVKSLPNHFVFKTQNQYLYQKIVGRKADENIESRNFLYLNPKATIYPYAIAFLSTNYRREIDKRYFGGLGITYQLINTHINNLKLSGNGLYEESHYTQQSFNESQFDGNSRLEAFWYSAYVSGFLILNSSSIRLVYELYWQQSLETSINYRYHIVTGLDFKVFKNLGLQTRYEYTYENVIVLGNKSSDTLWTWGVILNIKSNKS